MMDSHRAARVKRDANFPNRLQVLLAIGYAGIVILCFTVPWAGCALVLDDSSAVAPYRGHYHRFLRMASNLPAGTLGIARSSLQTQEPQSATGP